MIDSRIEMAEEWFRTLLLKWLVAMPPDGWEGTPPDLGAELDSFAERYRLVAYVPLCPGRKVVDLCGVHVSERVHPHPPPHETRPPPAVRKVLNRGGVRGQPDLPRQEGDELPLGDDEAAKDKV